MDDLYFNKKLALNQILIGTLEKALNHLNINWLDWENFKVIDTKFVWKKRKE
jgi:hypothetical protein